MANKVLKSFQNPVMYRGLEYVCCPALDINKAARNKELQGFKTLFVEIALHKNLRGVTDLHGQLYKPSIFLFVSKEKQTNQSL